MDRLALNYSHLVLENTMSNDSFAIALRVGSGLLFAGMVACVKLAATSESPTGQIVFFRSAFALIPLVLFLVITREFPSGLYTKKPIGHLLRCLTGCVAMFGSFATLSYLPIAEATILAQIAPKQPLFTASTACPVRLQPPVRWQARAALLQCLMQHP